MILVVDDDRLNCLLLSELLREAGFEVVSADNMKDALDMESDPRLKILILDSNLNPGSGAELLAQIRSRELARSGVRRPAIVVTGDTESSQQSRLLAAGFDHFVGKPYQPAALIAVVHNMLK